MNRRSLIALEIFGTIALVAWAGVIGLLAILAATS